MAVTITEFLAVKEDVKCHDEWINGNGKVGAKTRLKSLEDAVDRIERKLDKIGNAMWGIFAAVTVGVLVWLFTKLLPAILALIGTA